MNSILIKLVDFIAWISIVFGTVTWMVIAICISYLEYTDDYKFFLNHGIPHQQFAAFVFSHPILVLFAAVVGFFFGLGSSVLFAGFWVLISNINKNMTELVKLNREQTKIQRFMCEPVFLAENKSPNDKNPNIDLAPNISASRDNG
ncbi:hypothetical protein [Pseudomonas putida]|uniref:hypothetical protein n=1 Tax=Pseudomonas putida TaxID=303 RepID=UPI003D994BE2